MRLGQRTTGNFADEIMGRPATARIRAGAPTRAGPGALQPAISLGQPAEVLVALPANDLCQPTAPADEIRTAVR